MSKKIEMKKTNLKSGAILRQLNIVDRANILQFLRESDTFGLRQSIHLIKRSYPKLLLCESACLVREYWGRNPIELEIVYSEILVDVSR